MFLSSKLKMHLSLRSPRQAGRDPCTANGTPSRARFDGASRQTSAPSHVCYAGTLQNPTSSWEGGDRRQVRVCPPSPVLAASTKSGPSLGRSQAFADCRVLPS